MKFEFKINKYYLVGYAMMSKNKPFPDWQKLEEKIWQKYRDEPAYYFLNPKYISWALEKLQTDFTEKNIESVFTEQAKTLKKSIKKFSNRKNLKDYIKKLINIFYLLKNNGKRMRKRR